jgi:hypothetical protein
MGVFNMHIVRLPLVLPLMLLLCCGSSLALAGEAVFPPSVTERPSFSKPFWIDRSMFVSGDSLFIVGLATKAPTLEEGRTRSLESAKAELRGRSKALAEAQWQDVDTKELYEEKEPDGTFTVYRLVSVKTQGYSPLLLDPTRAQEVANILARLEAHRLRTAQEAEARAIQERQNRKRMAAVYYSPRRVDNIYILAASCHEKGERPACEVLDELDVLVLKLEAEGYYFTSYLTYEPPYRPRSR